MGRPQRRVAFFGLTLLVLMLLLALPGVASAASVQGTVTDASGTPLQGIIVTAYDPYTGLSYLADTSTQADGTYDLPGLGGGGYVVVGFGGAFTYLSEFYPAQDDWQLASWFWLDADTILTGIDATLDKPCSISGAVTDGKTGDPLAWSWVYLYKPGLWGWDYSSETMTNASGDYSFSGLRPGEYRLYFSSPDGMHIGEYYEDVLDVYAATSLNPADGEALTGIDGALDTYSSIAGTVNDSWGTPLSGIEIDLYRDNGDGSFGWWTYAYSDASGNYIFSGLTKSDYQLFYYDWSGRYRSEYFDDASTSALATTINLGGSQDITGIDAQLSQGGHIAGVVTDRAGDPVQNVYVSVYSSPGYGYVTSAWTGPDGRYDAYGLDPGSYRVQFYDSSGRFLSEWYDDQPDFASATDLAVALDLTTAADAVLDTLSTISGTVTGPTGDPMRNVYIDVYNADNDDWSNWVGWARTGSDGSYTVSNLAAGNYHLVYYPPAPYLSEYWNDKGSMAAADVVPVALGENVTGIDAQITTGASISGTVTGTGGAPVERAQVTAYRASGQYWEYAGDTSTDAAGGYVLGRLQDGRYRVQFDGGDRFFTEWWNDKPDRRTADDITVARDANVTGVDAQLSEGSSIEGAVTGPEDDPLQGIYVSVYQQNGHGSWDYIADTSTDAAGHYRIARLTGGTYRVGFHDWVGNDYLEEYWNDKADFNVADDVTLTPDETRTGIDAQLARASRMTGTVTDQAGDPVADVWVNAFRESPGGDWDYVADTSTDGNGQYLLKGLAPGSYRVEFRDWSGFWAPEWFDDKPSIAKADDILVGADETVPGIDAVLTQSGKIRGTVTSTVEGPVANEHVIAFAPDAAGGWEYFTDTTTDAAGQYELRGLASGDYRIRFADESSWPWEDEGFYLDEFWNDKWPLSEADTISVTAPNVVEGIDAVLTPAGHVTGTVTNSKGEPLQQVWVYAYKDRGSGEWDYVGDTSTDASGAYDIPGLRTGTYRLQFDPWLLRDYVGEFYNDKPSLDLADDVLVTAGETTGGIDAVLGLASQISGTVTVPSGDPLSEVVVTAYRQDEQDGYWFPWTDATTDAGGAYLLRGLTEGDYKVEFAPPTTEYAFEYWDDKATLAAADLVHVPAEGLVEHIDAQLGAGGSITGTVTVAGVPRGDVWVTAYAEKPGGGWGYVRDCTTDPDGTYDLGRARGAYGSLAAGTYRVKFDADDPELSPEFYNDKAKLAAADDVLVSAGADTTGIDADLGVSGKIAGTVTNEAGDPLADIAVQVYGDNGSGGFEYVADVTTDADGHYTVGGLGADSYRVGFFDWYGWPFERYVAEYYHDAATVEAATDVPVTAGSTTRVDETLTNVLKIVEVSSSSHPDENAWYADADAALAWLARDPAAVSAYSYSVNHDPTGMPDKLADTTGSSALVTGLADGTWYFHVRGVIGQNVWYWTEYLWGPAAHFALHIDTRAPTTAVSGADAAWHSGPVTLTLTPTDELSGMVGGAAKTEYSLDGGDTWTTGTSVEVSADGENTVLYRSTDNAGNTEADQSVTVKVDSVAPTTSVSGADEAWHRDPVTLLFAPEDAAGGSGMVGGAAKTEYSLDGGDTWTTGTSVEVSADGENTVLYRSTDAAGNTEMNQSVTVKIDTTAPATTQAGADGDWHNAPVTLTFTPADAGSGMTGGLARTEYKVDTGAWTTGTSVVVSGEGVHTVLYRSTDAIGNVEADNSVTVKIDSTAPVTTQTGADANWHASAVTVDFTPTDSGSGMTGGLADTVYMLDGDHWVSGLSVTVATVGVHELRFHSIDAAGNIEADQIVTIKIETNAPITVVGGADDLWHNQAVELTFSATDPDGSGVARTEYSLDGGTTWQDGLTVTIEGLAGGGTDGEHVVKYRSIDAVGNIEPVQSVTVKLDTVKPVTTAPRRASVLRGRRVTLKYKVSDATPNGGTAKARIVIRNKRGRVVLRSTWRTVTVNEIHSWRFRCKLKTGTYRFSVYGTDLANNKQSKIGSNRLTVR